MFDRDTLIVTYDAARGEPRTKRGRGETKPGQGDCIDCNLCVHVCPTGIDIRKGLQYECIACTACIDACDGVMDKMQMPRGLIRYATRNGLEKGWNRAQMWARVFRPRVLIYFAVLILISGLFMASLAMRSTLRVDVVRDRAALARIVDNGQVENVYRLQLMNATEQAHRYRIAVRDLPGATLVGAAETEVQAAQARWIVLAVRVPPDAAARLGTGAHPVAFEVAGEGIPAVVEKSTFVVPR
jgi:cytochrome c oxidase accessory protein FixG